MIKHANFTEPQKRILTQVCDIELDELIRLLSLTFEIHQWVLASGIGTTVEEIEAIIQEQITQFCELKNNPNALFKLEKQNRDLVELIIMWYIDQYDGDTEVNRIYSKIIQNNDLQKLTHLN